MNKLLGIFIVLILSNCNLYSQNKTVKGRVVSDQLDILRGVPIVISDSVVVGTTDSNGFFEISIPDSVNKIIFRDVGLETTNIRFLNKCGEVEVVMLLRATYDFISLKKADRLRKKSFKKLPELHKYAFERGLFKTDKPCYAQEFIPYFTKKQGH